LKIPSRVLSALLFCGLLAVPAVPTHAQAASPSAKPATSAGGEHMDEPENNSDIEQYRHSAVVQAIAEG